MSRCTIIRIALILLVALSVATSAASGSSRGCERARIGGRIECLHLAQRCSLRYQKVYLSYAFTCVHGRLRTRNYIGVPNP